jgi:NDP-sugar pyrophosphorylase family protein
MSNQKNLTEKFNCIILAAGLGKRLLPLTENCPKPLIQVQGRALIDYSLSRVSNLGFKSVWINLHYLPDQIREYVRDGSKWNLKVNFSFEEKLLETGGALKKLESEFQKENAQSGNYQCDNSSENILILNSDTFFQPEPDLYSLLQTHLNEPSETQATLLCQSVVNPLYAGIEVDQSGYVTKLLDSRHLRRKQTDHIVNFIGASCLRTSALGMIDEGVSSLSANLWTKCLERGLDLKTLIYDGLYSDVGTPEALHAIEHQKREEV